MIVKRCPPTVEYLGEHYPLFFDDTKGIHKLLDMVKISEAHQYLINMCKN